MGQCREASHFEYSQCCWKYRGGSVGGGITTHRFLPDNSGGSLTPRAVASGAADTDSHHPPSLRSHRTTGKGAAVRLFSDSLPGLPQNNHTSAPLIGHRPDQRVTIARGPSPASRIGALLVGGRVPQLPSGGWGKHNRLRAGAVSLSNTKTT